MKKIKLYNIRHYNNGKFSKDVGFKMRLVSRAQATKIVKRLKRAGVDAVAVPMEVWVKKEGKKTYLQRILEAA